MNSDIIKYMSKQSGILISLLAISVVFLLGYRGFGWENSFKGDKEVTSITTTLGISDLPRHEQGELEREAWQVFQNYLEFARTHNLAGIRSLSHQISSACSDPSKEGECFALMDSVYAIASPLKLSEFKYVQVDKRQIIMYTDAPTVAILYFTKDDTGATKMLGLRFCFEDKSALGSCVKTDSVKEDKDGDGWWDSVESLFY